VQVVVLLYEGISTVDTCVLAGILLEDQQGDKSAAAAMQCAHHFTSRKLMLARMIRALKKLLVSPKVTSTGK